MDKIKEIIVIGSITGYKYDETSDVDVNVGIKVPEEVEMKLKTHVVKDINGVPAPGSRHPINYFVQRWRPEMRTGYEDITFGAYDVLRDEWIAPPPNKSDFRDPEWQFKDETRVARMLVKAFNKKAQDYKEQMALLNSSNSAEHEKIRSAAMRILRDVREIVDQVEDGRQFAYSYG